VDVTPSTYTLEATGEESKLTAIIELLRPMGIQELVRTGKVAIARGSKTARRRAEEPLGKSADAQRRRRDAESSQDPRVSGFVD
jgi:Small subunit of acetolactate synthase